MRKDSAHVGTAKGECHVIFAAESGEYLTIGENVAIQVFREKGNRIRVAVNAPKDLTVLRGEVLDRNGADRPDGLIELPLSAGI